jgi:hypothetical protein
MQMTRRYSCNIMCSFSYLQLSSQSQSTHFCFSLYFLHLVKFLAPSKTSMNTIDCFSPISKGLQEVHIHIHSTFVEITLIDCFGERILSHASKCFEYYHEISLFYLCPLDPQFLSLYRTNVSLLLCLSRDISYMHWKVSLYILKHFWQRKNRI